MKICDAESFKQVEQTNQWPHIITNVKDELYVSSIVPCRGTYATVLLYVPAVLEIIFELHGFVYLGKHMSFWYFAEGDQPRLRCFFATKICIKGVLAFCEESREDKTS